MPVLVARAGTTAPPALLLALLFLFVLCPASAASGVAAGPSLAPLAAFALAFVAVSEGDGGGRTAATGTDTDTRRSSSGCTGSSLRSCCRCISTRVHSGRLALTGATGSRACSRVCCCRCIAVASLLALAFVLSLGLLRTPPHRLDLGLLPRRERTRPGEQKVNNVSTHRHSHLDRAFFFFFFRAARISRWAAAAAL